MSLITCPDCNKEISDKASSCPNCGCPVNKPIVIKKKARSDFNISTLIFFISLVVIIIVGAVIALPSLKRYSKKYSDLSDSHYKAACKVLDITDEFLDYSITADECCEQLESILSLLDSYNSDVTSDVIVESHILLLKIDISSLDRMSSKTTFDDIVESRNKLAEYIGKRKR